eukprot:s3249_g6.t1
MVLMKAVKRGAGAGNKNPAKRNAFPDVDQDKLDEEMDCYIRSMGVAASLDLLEYKNLQGQQAENPKALFKLHKLVEALLKVSPSGQIKYGQLRQSLQVACKKFGMELLQAHWQVEHAHLPGRAADALGVLLKHWRRVTSSQTAWDKFGRKLEESHFNQLQRLYKMMKPEGQTQRSKRELTAHISDVTVDSTGLPAMLKTSSEEGEENSSDCGSKGSLMDSPPPVGKGLWREKAGKPGMASKSGMDVDDQADWGDGPVENEGEPASGKHPQPEIKKETSVQKKSPPRAGETNAEQPPRRNPPQEKNVKEEKKPKQWQSKETWEEWDHWDSWEDDSWWGKNTWSTWGGGSSSHDSKGWAEGWAKKAPCKPGESGETSGSYRERKKLEMLDQQCPDVDPEVKRLAAMGNSRMKRLERRLQEREDKRDQEKKLKDMEQKVSPLELERSMEPLPLAVAAQALLQLQKACTSVGARPKCAAKSNSKATYAEGLALQRAPVMGKAMKVKKKHVKNKSHGKGKGPGKGQSPEKGTKPKGILKRPSTLALPNRDDPGLSLEEKMEQFAKKSNGNTQEFLDSLSAGQREALWGRFARARKALKDQNLNSLWDKHCKGEGSEQHKKQLLSIYLKSRGDRAGGDQ